MDRRSQGITYILTSTRIYRSLMKFYIFGDYMFVCGMYTKYDFIWYSICYFAHVIEKKDIVPDSRIQNFRKCGCGRIIVIWELFRCPFTYHYVCTCIFVMRVESKINVVNFVFYYNYKESICMFFHSKLSKTTVKYFSKGRGECPVRQAWVRLWNRFDSLD